MAGGEQQQPQDQEKPSWEYRPENSAAFDSTVPSGGSAPQSSTTIDWTASEFIAHEKGMIWYVILGGSTLGVAAVLYLITHDIVSTCVVVALGVILGIAGASKPRLVAYRLDRGGLSVGKQFHPYGSFKSYAVVDEGAFASITLLPIKRLSLPISIYFSPEDEHKIMDALSTHLPLQPGQLDSVDMFMPKIHF